MYKNLVSRLVQTAFETVKDLADEVNYVQFADGTYDVATSTPTYTFNYQVGLKGIFTSFDEKEMDDEIQVMTDQKLLIPNHKFNLILDQATEDSIIDSKGKSWQVKRFMGITGESLLKFHVRR